MASSINRSTGTFPHPLDRAAPAAVSPWLALAGWVGLCVIGGALVGLGANSADSPWYAALRKPAWTPPSWVFAPVWTTLYALMGIAAWRVWRRGGWATQGAALTLFMVQLLVNFAWSPLFFAAEMPLVALADLILLWTLVAATIQTFYGIDRLAAWLLVPYLAWATFAAALNTAIVAAN